MKTKSILAALLLMACGVQTTWAQLVVLHKTNGQTIECDISELDSITFEQGHEWVDLGLPSGTLWATCNIGANSPEEYGDYFAWGETEPKDDYSIGTYKYSKGSEDSFTKYCTNGEFGYNGYTDELMELLPEDDAATANWGSDWQMPSLEQCYELCSMKNVNKEFTTYNGVYGCMLTSKSNGKSIFFPATGLREGESNLNGPGSVGFFLSRTLFGNPLYSWEMDFWDTMTVGVHPRWYGKTVRPVRVKNTQP